MMGWREMVYDKDARQGIVEVANADVGLKRHGVIVQL